MIITIDGPTASGKSTLARLLAQKLGYTYINSGLLYRAVAYIYHTEYHLAIDDTIIPDPRVISVITHPENLVYSYSPDTGAQILYKNQDITIHLKDPQIDRYASIMSSHQVVRDYLLPYQRQLAVTSHIVIDGRDCGTVLFPYAEHKFFLIASEEKRSQRWLTDQKIRGYCYTQEEAQALLRERDMRDTQRILAPLVRAVDAHEIDNSDKSLHETVDVFCHYITRKQGDWL